MWWKSATCHLPQPLVHLDKWYGRVGVRLCFLTSEIPGDQDNFFRVLLFRFPSFHVSLPHFFLQSLPNYSYLDPTLVGIQTKTAGGQWVHLEVSNKGSDAWELAAGGHRGMAKRWKQQGQSGNEDTPIQEGWWKLTQVSDVLSNPRNIHSNLMNHRRV